MKKMSIAVLCLLLTAITSSACATDASQPSVTETADITTAVTETAVTEDPRLPLSLPADLDLSGETFRFLSISTALMSGDYATPDLWAETENADPLNDAVFARNRAVEDLLGVDIGIIEKDDPASEIRKVVQANDCPYDAVWCFGTNSYSLAAEGYFLDLNTIPNMSLSSPWWDQNLLSDFAFGDQNFVITGDISTRDDACAIMLFFNKGLIAQYDLTSPYTHVKNGTWTIDVYAEMARSVSKDINGDGVMADGDQYGMIGSSGVVNRFFQSAGGTFFEEKTDGSYAINVSSERNLDIYNKILDLMLDKNAVSNFEKWTNKGPDNDVYTYVRSLFIQDKYLFYITGARVIDGGLREMESDFGIVPVPMYDAADGRYYSVVDEFAPLMAVTVNTPSTEKTGAVLEAIAWESMYTLTPVYTETMLQRKYARDNESGEMLKIIANSRVYNIMGMTDWGGLYSIARNAYTSGKTVAVSDFEKKLSAAEKALQKDMEKFDALRDR